MDHTGTINVSNALRQEAFEVRGFKIVMSEANVIMAVRRFRYMTDGKPKEGEETDPDIEILATMIWPNIRASIISVKDSNGAEVDPSFEWFIGQPEEVWDALTAHATSLNPTWFSDERPVAPKDSTPSTPG